MGMTKNSHPIEFWREFKLSPSARQSRAPAHGQASVSIRLGSRVTRDDDWGGTLHRMWLWFQTLIFDLILSFMPLMLPLCHLEHSILPVHIPSQILPLLSLDCAFLTNRVNRIVFLKMRYIQPVPLHHFHRGTPLKNSVVLGGFLSDCSPPSHVHAPSKRVTALASQWLPLSNPARQNVSPRQSPPTLCRSSCDSM